MRAKRIARNLAAGALAQIINILVNMVLPPLIISNYGSKIYGLISSIKQLMNYASLVGGGIATATIQALYVPLAENDNKATSGMLNAASRMLTRAGSVFSVLAVSVAFVYPLILQNEIEYLTIVKLVIVMSIAGASEFFVVGKLQVLLSADQKAYVSALIQSGAVLVSLLVTVILIKANGSIILVQLLSSLIYVLRIFVLRMYVKKKYPYLNALEPPIKAAVAKKNDALVHQLVGMPVLQSQTIILSTFVGLEAASIYAVYNIVFNGLISICFQISNTATPFLGRTIALGNKEQIKSEFGELEFIFSMLSTFIYSVCAVMLMPFITIYVGKYTDVNYVDYAVGLLFFCLSFLNTCRFPALCAINAAGHFKETKYRAITEAAICVGLQLVLVKPLGIYGVLIASIVALGYRSVDIILYANKHIINQKSRKSWLRMLKDVSTIIIIIIFSGFTFDMRINNIFDWTIWACIISMITLIYMIAINMIFECSMMKQTLRIIKLMLKKA